VTLAETLEDVRAQAGNPPDASYLTHAAESIRRRIVLLQQRGQLAERLQATAAQLADVRASNAEFEAAANTVEST